MKYILPLFWVYLLQAGCGTSQPAHPVANPHTVYIQPISPMHQSDVRKRPTSASYSESDNGLPMSLQQAILRIERMTVREEKKENVIQPNTPKPRPRLKSHRSSSQPGNVD